MVTAPLLERRTRLHQLPREAMEMLWRKFEPSDPYGHRECGWIPAGESCHVCDKRLGAKLAYPYSYQSAVLDDDHLTCQVAGGEQTGKSTIGAMKFLQVILAFLGEHTDRAKGEVAWIVADSYELTAREFGYIAEWLARTPTKFETSKGVDPGEIRINVPGGVFTIKTRSAKDAQTLRAESPVVALVCEAALLSFDAYLRLRSRVARARADFPGYGAIIMASTFEGSIGWYPSKWKDWQRPNAQEKENAKSYSLPSFSNVFIYKQGESDPEILAMKAELGADEYSERVLAIPSPPRGRVHQAFDITTHVYAEDVPYDPAKPVLIGIDPGYSGQPSTYAVEVFQPRDLPCGKKHFWGIDEIFEWKLTTENICHIAMQRQWWKNPMKLGVSDVAGRQHTPTSPDTNIDIWRKQTGIVLMSQVVDVLPGIRRMDSMLTLCPDPSCGEPVLIFSSLQKGLIAEMGGGPHPHDGQTHVYRWHTDREGNAHAKVPIDAYNDATKATTYLFMNYLGPTITYNQRNKIKVRQRVYGEVYA